MKWTLINPAGTNDPDTGDIYSGLDRFGRVKDNRWLDGTGDELDRIQYGHDQAGNRVWRRNAVADALGKHFDELYGYDAIHRLKEMQRGTLNNDRTAIDACGFAQCWTLDSTGNWQGFRQADSNCASWDLVQQRAANPVNEIGGITNAVGSGWAQPAYSRAGNMTTLPQPADPTQSYTATYDAWNRLVKIADGADTVAEYQYDGANRRIVQKSYTGGVLDETRHLYYTKLAQWQVIEERVGTSPDSADAERQFVWGRRYIDDIILRDRDTDNDGSLDERLYALQDANWNVTAIVDDAEDVQERYVYATYGLPGIFSASFNPAVSMLSWEYLFCGYLYSYTLSVYCVRHRAFHPTLGVWVQRDPLRYADGPSLYCACFVPSATDPFGLQAAIDYPPGGPIPFPPPQGVPQLNQAQCNKELEALKANTAVKALLDEIAKRGCPAPTISCGATGGRDSGLNDDGRIVIDTPITKGELFGLLRHELIHSLDQCTSGLKNAEIDCKRRICMELRANSCSGQWEYKDRDKRRAEIILQVYASIRNSRGCEDYTKHGSKDETKKSLDAYKDMVNRLWKDCTCDCYKQLPPELPEGFVP
ncbi:MAG: hypothetical protein SH850_03795 [Planctomycetaceae bacterium]|nr:hypothetical protein [Planctomycetaceae bacterium]